MVVERDFFESSSRPDMNTAASVRGYLVLDRYEAIRPQLHRSHDHRCL